MSKWHKFAEKQKAKCDGVEMTPHRTTTLRYFIKKDGSQVLEQLVEYRNDKGMVLDTEWVAIPTILEV